MEDVPQTLSKKASYRSHFSNKRVLTVQTFSYSQIARLQTARNITKSKITKCIKIIGLIKKLYQILSRNIEGKFNEHLESKITNCNKIIGLMKELSQFHSRKSLLTFYKSFVRPNLDYADITTTNH